VPTMNHNHFSPNESQMSPLSLLVGYQGLAEAVPPRVTGFLTPSSSAGLRPRPGSQPALSCGSAKKKTGIAIPLLSDHSFASFAPYG